MYDVPNFLKPYVAMVREEKSSLNKCKQCKYFIVTRTNNDHTRGRGECYHNPYNRYGYNPRVRYFSDQCCKNFEVRTKPLNLFIGGVGNESKISILYKKYEREHCKECKGRLYYHDDTSIFCKCKKLRHTIEEV